MHVAMIIDDARLSQEQVMLNRLGVGLMSEGVQLTRIIPQAPGAEIIDEGEQRIALASRIEAPLKVLPWMRKSRLARITEALGEAPPEVIYAVGEKTWELALDLGRALNRPVLIDVWSAAQQRIVPRVHGHTTLAGYVAPCPGIADALASRVGRDLVSLVPMGVALPARVRTALPDPQRPPAVAVLGGSRELPAYQAMFAGLARLAGQTPTLQVVLELQGPHEHEVWRLAEKADLLHLVSAIGEASHYRSLLTRCDILLMPERRGDLRSLMLEAMALGLPIVTPPIPALDMLIDEQTAVFVRQHDGQTWESAIQRLLKEVNLTRSIGAAGREYVAAHHRSSDQIARLLETFHRVVDGDVLRFAAKKP